ncbi:MAG TPA: gas vesicle protein [Solirubrobacteraceae bacterium]|jgi:hypothetical protein|nr:gas vesicle protein [Solirubrobacteraceae bacterium]
MTERAVVLPTEREVSLVEVLDRALGAGVVLTGDVTISLADVDLVYLSLRVLVGSVGTIGSGSDVVDTDALSLGRGEP